MDKFKITKTNHTDEQRLIYLENYLRDNEDDMCDLEIYKREKWIKSLRKKISKAKQQDK